MIWLSGKTSLPVAIATTKTITAENSCVKAEYASGFLFSPFIKTFCNMAAPEYVPIDIKSANNQVITVFCRLI